MQYLPLILLFISLSTANTICVKAKINNSFEQNAKDWGEAIELNPFPSKKGFSGYASYNAGPGLKLIAYYNNNQVRSEHLISADKSNLSLNREQCKNWAIKMFDLKQRGAYKKQLDMPRVQGHFFDKGLVTYEYVYKNGKRSGAFQSVKVLIYDGNVSYIKINPKAYI
ncbi:MAG: hypothetical protein LW817_07320 [Candidatus Caenarcaniphilales bacterium]|jgi:hypothetical protein|nr:hypothetical protein [Candidatus Caenarcaniphilales bacterium]